MLRDVTRPPTRGRAKLLRIAGRISPSVSCRLIHLIHDYRLHRCFPRLKFKPEGFDCTKQRRSLGRFTGGTRRCKVDWVIGYVEVVDTFQTGIIVHVRKENKLA